MRRGGVPRRGGGSANFVAGSSFPLLCVTPIHFRLINTHVYIYIHVHKHWIERKPRLSEPYLT